MSATNAAAGSTKRSQRDVSPPLRRRVPARPAAMSRARGDGAGQDAADDRELPRRRER